MNSTNVKTTAINNDLGLVYSVDRVNENQGGESPLWFQLSLTELDLRSSFTELIIDAEPALAAALPANGSCR